MGDQSMFRKNKSKTSMQNFSFSKKIDECNTPAFIYDVSAIRHKLALLRNFTYKADLKILFPIKTFSIPEALRFMVPYIDGYSVASLFHAVLAREISDRRKIIHTTSPGLKSEEINELVDLSNYMSFNSLYQLHHYYNRLGSGTSRGLRINPQLAFVEDKRYDPCVKHSKLGVPLNSLSKILKDDSKSLNGIEGILIHSNCESENLNELKKTVFHIESKLPDFFYQLKWINLGGGYLFESSEDLIPLSELAEYLSSKYDVEIFFEPGKAIVGNAGYIVSTVLDIFESEGKTIAVLDTTVNHMPEVFEYQYKPEVVDTVQNSEYKYILAGCTCLAGDLFGEYCFNEPLEIGSRVIFKNVGAYTLVKAHMFNGVNLPDIYALTLDGKLELKKRYTYEEFLQRCGGYSFEAKRKAVNDPES